MKARLVRNTEGIEAIIRKCEVCYIGLVDQDGTPYVVPMNFGFRENEIYLHSAQQGRKMDIFRRGGKVAFAFSTDHELKFQSEHVACSYSMRYRSVLGTGKVVFIEDHEEKIDVLNVVMSQYTDREFTYSPPSVREVACYKIVVDEISARELGY